MILYEKALNIERLNFHHHIDQSNPIKNPDETQNF